MKRAFKVIQSVWKRDHLQLYGRRFWKWKNTRWKAKGGTEYESKFLTVIESLSIPDDGRNASKLEVMHCEVNIIIFKLDKCKIQNHMRPPCTKIRYTERRKIQLKNAMHKWMSNMFCKPFNINLLKREQ